MFMRPRPLRRPIMGAAMVGGAGFLAGRRAAQGAAREAEQEARLQALEASQPPPAAPPPAPAPAAAAAPAGGDIASKLVELKGLLDAGALTAEEFEAAKRQLLGG